MRVFFLKLARTPFLRIFTGFHDETPLSLATKLVNTFIENLKPKNPDLLLASSVLPDPEIPNLAREIVLRSTLPKTIPGIFVSNYCISSLVSTSMAFDLIKAASFNTILLVGVEVMSNPKLFLSQDASKKLVRVKRAKTWFEKIQGFLSLRIRDFKLIAPSPKEPSTNLSMGESCELMNQVHKISRSDQDEFALASHTKATRAIEAGYLKDQIIEIDGIKEDNIPRKDSSLDKLRKLPTIFAKDGSLTAGNSSSLTDGASVGLLVSESELKNYQTEPECEILGYTYSSVDLSDGLLMAPVVAIHNLLHQHKLTPEDIDVFELHEAFACQVLINLRVLMTGWSKYSVNPTKIPIEKVNIWGGSLAFGHPFAATGLRLLKNASDILKATKGRLGIVASCAAGGGGAAILIKNPNSN